MAKLIFDTYGNEKQKQAISILLNQTNGITDVGYGGGAGGGKSYLGVFWQWSMRNRYPGTRGFFGRKELKKLKQTTLATYYKFCEDYNIPQSQRGILNSQDGCITFPNKSEILLLDLSYQPSDPLYTRFGSLEFTDGFADEIAEIDAQCLMILKTRIGRHRNEEYNLLPKFLGTFNPDKGHVYRDYYKPYKEGILQNYRIFIPALATDNKKLPKVYIEQLKKADEVTKQRLLYGNFDYDDTPGRLFDYNSILNIWDNIANNGTNYITGDIARQGQDKTVIYVWDGLELIYVLTEDKSDLKLLSDTIKKLMQEYSVELKNVILDENGLGGGLIDILKCQGFINNAKPIQPKKINLSNIRNYENLKTQCCYRLSEYVNQGKIKFSVYGNEFKEKVIEELDIVVQKDIDKDGKFKIIHKEEMKEKIGRSPDYLDALIFRMFYELNDKTPISQEEQETIQFNPYNNKMEKKTTTLEFDIFGEDDNIQIEFDDNPFN